MPRVLEVAADVMTAGDGGVVSIAERTLGLVLACRKELPLLLRAGSWDPDGKQRGRLLQGAGVRVVAPSASDDAARLEVLLAPTGAQVVRADGVTAEDVATTDVLVLLPGAPPVGSALLAALPDDAALVDASAATGAAPSCDLGALAAGSAAGRPRHAALLVADAAVTVPAGHALWAAPRVLVVPHGPVAA